jgi:hypothetical protein
MPPRLSTVTIERFRGLQTTLRRNQTAPGQATLLRNLTVRDGTLRKLPGQSLWGTCTGSTKPCRWFGLHRRTDGGITALAYAGDDTNGHLYYKKDPTGTDPQALAELLDGSAVPAAVNMALDSHAVEGVNLHRCTYVTDGTGLYVYDGEAETLSRFTALTAPVRGQQPTLTHKVAYNWIPCVDDTGWTSEVVASTSGTATSSVADIGGVPGSSSIGHVLGGNRDGGDAEVFESPLDDNPMAIGRTILWKLDRGADTDTIEGRAYYDHGSRVDFTTGPQETDSIHFLVALTFIQPYEAIASGGSPTNYLRAALWNGTPGDPGVKKVTVDIRGVVKRKWALVSISRAEAERQATTGSDQDADFWKHIQAAGVEAKVSLYATSGKPQEFSMFLGGIYAPGMLADQVQPELVPLKVGYSLYNSVTGVESGISPTEVLDLFPDTEDMEDVLHAERTVNLYGCFDLQLPDVAFSPAPTHIRIYATPDEKTWYLLSEVAWVQGTTYTVNEALISVKPPHQVSTADIVPSHLATWTHCSRLVAAGCLYDADNDGVKEPLPERLWISDWIDPLTGRELYWSPSTYAGPQGLTEDEATDQGMYFDLGGAGEILAAIEFGGWIWTFARGGVWVVQGLDASDWQCIQVNQAIGCQSSGSVVKVLGGILYLGTDNVVYRLDGGLSPQPVGVGEDGVCPIKGLLDGLSDEHLQESVGLFADGYYLLSFPPECPVAGIAYDTLSGAWLELAGRAFSRGHRGAPNLSDPDQNQQMALAGDLEPAATDTPKGRVLRMLTPGTYSDFGEPLEARWRSGLIPLAEGGGRVHGAVLRLRVTASPEAPIDLTVTGDTGDEVHFAQRSTSSEEPETLRTRTPSRWTRGMQVEVAQTSTADLVVEELALQPMGWRKDL